MGCHQADGGWAPNTPRSPNAHLNMGQNDKSATPVQRPNVQVLFDHAVAFFDLKRGKPLLMTAEPSINCSHAIAGSPFFGCVKPCV